MKKTVLLSFLLAVMLVNLAAWAVENWSEVTIVWPFRIALILGITFIAAVFSGAAALVSAAEQEKPVNQPSRQKHD